MALEPDRQGVGGAVFQQVDRTSGLHVHQHRAVGVAATKREFVHPDHPQRSRLHDRLGQAADLPQQRHAAHRDGQVAGEPLASPAAQRQPDLGEGGRKQRGAALVAAGEAGWLLGEDLAGAVGGVAAPAANLQADAYLAACNAQVVEPADVAAVDPAGRLPAGWAGRRLGGGAGVEADRCAGGDHAVNADACRRHVREQDLKQRNPHTSRNE